VAGTPDKPRLPTAAGCGPLAGEGQLRTRSPGPMARRVRQVGQLAGHVPERGDVLRPGGILVSLLPGYSDPDEAAKAAERGVRVEALLVEADHAGMKAIADLVETGALRAHIEATFPLAEAAKAHALGEANHTTGKIVLTVEETG
jgi:NADPH:quinone reductase-like Zn-dependent oxidoreductase